MKKLIITIIAVATLALLAPASAMATTYVGSWNYGGEVTIYKHPRSLVLGPYMSANANSMYLQHIKWSNWGHRTSTATAKYRFRSYEPWAKVTIKAFRIRSSTGIRTYTRIRTQTRARGGTVTWKAPQPLDYRF